MGVVRDSCRAVVPSSWGMWLCLILVFLGRRFLQALVLSGETQERERILYQFSKRFHYCNPGAFPSVGMEGGSEGGAEGLWGWHTNSLCLLGVHWATASGSVLGL